MSRVKACALDSPRGDVTLHEAGRSRNTTRRWKPWRAGSEMAVKYRIKMPKAKDINTAQFDEWMEHLSDFHGTIVGSACHDDACYWFGEFVSLCR